MIPPDLPDGTPVRLTVSVVTPHVVYARGSSGRLYGPPNSKGYVQVRIGGCYLLVNVQDLVTLDVPCAEVAETGDDADTPESGGYKLFFGREPDSDPAPPRREPPRHEPDDPFGLDP